MFISEIISGILTDSKSTMGIIGGPALFPVSYPIIWLSFLWITGSLDIWAITVEERAKHDQQFHSLKPISGFITGNWSQYFHIFTSQ